MNAATTPVYSSSCVASLRACSFANELRARNRSPYLYKMNGVIERSVAAPRGTSASAAKGEREGGLTDPSGQASCSLNPKLVVELSCEQGKDCSDAVAEEGLGAEGGTGVQRVAVCEVGEAAVRGNKSA